MGQNKATNFNGGNFPIGTRGCVTVDYINVAQPFNIYVIMAVMKMTS